MKDISEALNEWFRTIGELDKWQQKVGKYEGPAEEKEELEKTSEAIAKAESDGTAPLSKEGQGLCKEDSEKGTSERPIVFVIGQEMCSAWLENGNVLAKGSEKAEKLLDLGTESMQSRLADLKAKVMDMMEIAKEHKSGTTKMRR